MLIAYVDKMAAMVSTTSAPSIRHLGVLPRLLEQRGNDRIHCAVDLLETLRAGVHDLNG